MCVQNRNSKVLLKVSWWMPNIAAVISIVMVDDCGCIYIWLENFLKYIFLIHQNQYLYKKGPNIGGDTIVVVIWLIGISPIDTCLTSRYCFFCSLSSSCTDRKLIKNCGLVFCWSICHHIHNVNYHEKWIFLPSIYYRTCVYFA